LGLSGPKGRPCSHITASRLVKMETLVASKAPLALYMLVRMTQTSPGPQGGLQLYKAEPIKQRARGGHVRTFGRHGTERTLESWLALPNSQYSTEGTYTTMQCTIACGCCPRLLPLAAVTGASPLTDQCACVPFGAERGPPTLCIQSALKLLRNSTYSPVTYNSKTTNLYTI
jgi:hypothetical protein